MRSPEAEEADVSWPSSSMQQTLFRAGTEPETCMYKADSGKKANKKKTSKLRAILPRLPTHGYFVNIQTASRKDQIPAPDTSPYFRHVIIFPAFYFLQTPGM